MTDEMLTGDEMIAFCAADAESMGNSLIEVIERNRELLTARARGYNPAAGAHGWIDIYELDRSYTDERVLIAAGLLDAPAYTVLRKLTSKGAEVFGR